MLHQLDKTVTQDMKEQAQQLIAKSPEEQKAFWFIHVGSERGNGLWFKNASTQTITNAFNKWLRHWKNVAYAEVGQEVS